MLSTLRLEKVDDSKGGFVQNFFSDRLNLAVTIHFGSFVGAEAITAGKELLADARFTKTHNLLWDMRRITSMTLYDTDRAFAHQASKEVYEPLIDSRIVLLYDPDNPVNKIHKKRRALIQKETAQPGYLESTSFVEAAEWLGVNQQDLSFFIEQNFSTQSPNVNTQN
ncbi:MAG: hypothetical protein P8N51_16195 [Pseudomonadales bacterium]|nr:hypothetical protein [Pseudomonadales bacterium]MDG1443425.1 hypothetical protein [Pseudomonadales bacterium]